MITVQAAESLPPLAVVKAEPAPRSEPTAIGLALLRGFREAIAVDPRMSVRGYVVMPDHAHFVIFVEEPLDRVLGNFIGKAKALATGEIRRLLGRPDLDAFTPGFNDRIVRGRTQLATLVNYVRDNPRRLVVKRQNPDYFTTRRSVEVCGRRFDAMGNMFLLDEAEFDSVVIHRAWSSDLLEEMTGRWLRCAENGGVLVSPFISEAEKAVMHRALELGGRIIVMTKDKISERFKPQGEYFELCAEGRALLLHPEGMEPSRYGKITRGEALALNRTGEAIAAGLGR